MIVLTLSRNFFMSAKNLSIHPTAIVAEGAKVAADVKIGAYAVIGENVSLGEGTQVNAHAVIDGYTTIGKNNVIFQFSSVGSVPQDLKYRGEASRLEIGDNNIVREYVTLQPGTEKGCMVTRIGDGNLFMVGSHVGHDAQIGNQNVFANYCSLAGHVTVGNRVTVGGLSGIHQFVRIGDLAILGAGAMVAQDIPPYCLAQGDHAKLLGLNRVGLNRAGFSSADIVRLRKLFRLLIWPFKDESGKTLTMAQRIALHSESFADLAAAQAFIAFLKEESSRGIAAINRKKSEEE
jgi:UDP-N-acetylglucosamine acyltransferase